MSDNAFTCPACGMISYNPKDIEHRYCGKCHRFFPRGQGRRSRYVYSIYGKFVLIMDSGNGKLSVTNDAERVIDDLVDRNVGLSDTMVLYCDSLDTWDEILVKDNAFAGFHRLGAKTAEEAMILALTRRRSQNEGETK
jgi:hypothetical protein